MCICVQQSHTVIATLQIRKLRSRKGTTIFKWQLQSGCFQHPCPRPPLSSQLLAHCRDFSNTAFHLIWNQCPNSASCTFIFKRENIASPLRMDLESWACTSKRQEATGQGQPPLVYPLWKRHRHFIS